MIEIKKIIRQFTFNVKNYINLLEYKIRARLKKSQEKIRNIIEDFHDLIVILAFFII